MKKFYTTLGVITILLMSIGSAHAQGFFARKKLAKTIVKHSKTLNSEGYNERTLGTADENRAAHYIAQSFASIGLDSTGTQAYFQNINVPSLRMAQGNSSLLIDGMAYTLFTDYYPLSESSNNGRYAGDAIQVSYGIDDPGLNRADYSGVDIAGKAALINVGLPVKGEEVNKYLAWQSIESRVNLAKNKGARAVIFYTTDANYKPSGKLAKVLENSNIPVLFVTRDMSTAKLVKLDLNVDILLLNVSSQNVIGTINNNAKTTVLITTHHDNTYTNYEDLRNNSKTVATFLALAKEIKTNPKLFSNNNYLFVSFTGYEDKFLGARYLINSAFPQATHLNYMVSLDELGNLDSNQRKLVWNGIGSSSAFTAPLFTLPKGFTELTTNGKIANQSETTLFYANKTPVLSINASSKYTAESKRPKAGTLEANLTQYLCKTLATLDASSTSKNGQASNTNEPKQAVNTIPFTPLAN
jgi:aminopeptidase YwaD